MSRPLSSCFLRVIKRSQNDQESLMSLVVVQVNCYSAWVLSSPSYLIHTSVLLFPQQIPPEFVQIPMRGDKGCVAELKLAGVHEFRWSVLVQLNTKNETRLTTNWSKFLDDVCNKLEQPILVFKYYGDMSFKVKRFNHTGVFMGGIPSLRITDPNGKIVLRKFRFICMDLKPEPLFSIDDAPGPYQISVKGSSLDPWEVSAVRLLVSLTFRDGWDSFAETYNIETENCAMFVYEGLMYFTVIPFNKTSKIVDVDGGERFTVAVAADNNRALRGQNSAAEERFTEVDRNGVVVGGDPSGGGRRSSRIQRGPYWKPLDPNWKTYRVVTCTVSPGQGRFVTAEARDLFPDDLPENYVVCVQKSDGRTWDTKVIKDCSTKALSSGFSNLVKSMGLRHKQKLQLHVVSNRHFVLE